MNPSRPIGRHTQRGLTLVELLVAMGLGLMMITIALAALLLGQRGFTTVDSTAQVRDKERFIVDLVTRIVKQAGYQDLANPEANSRYRAAKAGTDPEPDLYGWNNARYALPPDRATSGYTNITDGSRGTCGATSGLECKNGSDILVVRYQGVSVKPNSAKADNSMIDCSGTSARDTGGDMTDRAFNMFAVDVDTTTGGSKEPSLICTYFNFEKGTLVRVPLIEGVESFQVLYGTVGLTPGAAASASFPAEPVVDRWLRADQLKVAGNAAATRENFRRVIALRIGIVVRGPQGSMPEPKAKTFYPLGQAYGISTTGGSDAGAALAAPADRRVRQQFDWVIHLPNNMTTSKL